MLKFELNKGNLDLAKEEVLALVGNVDYSIKDDVLAADVEMRGEFENLAFTKAVYSGDKSLKLSGRFEERRAHLLPAGHPAMTHPRLARAMVNLSGARGEILDPFCGAGGILIEAGLVGLKCVGFDIDEKMLKRAEINLQHFGVDFKLERKDATNFSGDYEAIVTDLPYGKSTKVNDDLENLYLKFLENVKVNKIKKLVVGFPDFVDYKMLIGQAGMKLEKEFTYYLHKSLSKKIVVIDSG